MNKSRKTAIQTYELSELRTITLGEYPQKIMIDGKYKNNPIISAIPPIIKNIFQVSILITLLNGMHTIIKIIENITDLTI